MSFEIADLDARHLSDDDIAKYNEFGNAMRAERVPDDPAQPLEATTAFVRNIPSFVDVHGYVIPDGDVWVAGALVVGFNSGDNAHVLQVELDVLPGYRERGMAKAMLARVVALADELERTLLIANTHERAPAGAAFAQRIGAEPALSAHTNRLVLAELDRDMVRRWVDEGPSRAPGYELVGFDGSCPDELVADVAKVLNVMNDAPRDELQVEDREYTVEMIRDMEKIEEADGSEAWWLFAREKVTGRLVGLTDVHWNANQPDTVFQGNTGVHPEHRGHALGKWLKAAMLQRILDERPVAVDVRTGNADSNDAMLGINHQLGFKPFIANTTWQVPVERVKAYLAGG